MATKRSLLIQRISGLGLIIIGFSLLAIIFNTKGLMVPTTDRAILFLIFFAIGTMIAFGSYLASGSEPKKAIEPLFISGLSIIFILIILYLPLPKNILILVLGFSTFIPLLLWIAYIKLKAKYRKERDA